MDKINPLTTILWTTHGKRSGIAPIGERSSSVKLDVAALLVLSQIATFAYPTAITELELSAAREKRSARLSKPDGQAPTPAFSRGRLDHAR